MKRASAVRAQARLLEVRTVDIVSGRGGSLAHVSVRCPVHGRSSAVEACAKCAGAGAIAQDALARGEYLSCAALPAERRDGGGEPGEHPWRT